jgi:hypothetical protein
MAPARPILIGLWSRPNACHTTLSALPTSAEHCNHLLGYTECRYRIHSALYTAPYQCRYDY